MKKGKMSNLKASITGLAIMLLLSGALIAFSEPMYKSIAGRNRPISGEPIYNPGIYEGSARGYGGPVTVIIEVTEYEIEDVKISAPDETPEIGMAVAEKLSKEIWLNQSHSLDSVSGATMTSNAIKKAFAECLRGAAKEGTELARIIEAELNEENSERALPKVSELLARAQDGTYFFREEREDGNGFYNQVEIVIKENRITSLTWDAVNNEGVGKAELSRLGQYDMTENGPKWFEQSDLLCRYVLENQTTEGLMNDGGTTDAIASVSIHVGGFIDTLKKSLLIAGGDLSHAGVSDLLKMTGDGIYSYLSETADDKGFRDQIQITVRDHKIKALIWDCVGEDGIGKRSLSESGNYNMTENGPKWYEQADALAAYVLENQSAAGLMNAEGGTDAVASVSIYIGGFEDALKKCLRLANGDVSGVTIGGLLRNKQDGKYSYLSKTADENGFRDKIDLTVKDHRITSLVWDAVNESGAGKRQLSAEGNYDMTENGPKWYEQADALAAFLAERQSENGLLDESGYVMRGDTGGADAVASVSIYVGGFVNAVKRCLVE